MSQLLHVFPLMRTSFRFPVWLHPPAEVKVCNVNAPESAVQCWYAGVCVCQAGAGLSVVLYCN